MAQRKGQNTWDEHLEAFLYTCVKCAAKREKISLDKAAVWIIAHSPAWEKKQKRSEKYMHSMTNVQLIFPGLDKKGRRDITRDMMVDLWSPMLDAIARKAQHMNGLEELHGRRKELTEQMQSDDLTTEEVQDILKELGGIFKEDELLAFMDKEDQQRWQDACKYSDEWVGTDHM